MATDNKTKTVYVNLHVDEKPTWVKASVTWEDERSMRVTPIDGDPLHSIHIDKINGKGDLYRDA